MADHYGDVVYEVWRRGGNPDHLDRDRVREDLAHGDYADEIAEREIRREERPARIEGRDDSDATVGQE